MESNIQYNDKWEDILNFYGVLDLIMVHNDYVMNSENLTLPINPRVGNEPIGKAKEARGMRYTSSERIRYLKREKVVRYTHSTEDIINNKYDERKGYT